MDFIEAFAYCFVMFYIHRYNFLEQPIKNEKKTHMLKYYTKS